jgi:predicted NBD/HSP70 family sugar kinase
LIIISGSLVELPDIYFQAFEETLRRRAIRPTADKLEIVFSDFSQDAGVIGAAALVFGQIEYDGCQNNMEQPDNRGGADD